MKCEHVEDVAACITKGVHAKRILEPLDAGMIRTIWLLLIIEIFWVDYCLVKKTFNENC